MNYPIKTYKHFFNQVRPFPSPAPIKKLREALPLSSYKPLSRRVEQFFSMRKPSFTFRYKPDPYFPGAKNNKIPYLLEESVSKEEKLLDGKDLKPLRLALKNGGTLKQDAKGLIYLSLAGYGKIPVITETETEEKWLEGFIPFDKTFHFTLEGYYSLRQKGQTIYFIKIHSEGLREFREKLILPGLILGHSFHIECKRKKERFEKTPFMRINPACQAA